MRWHIYGDQPLTERTPIEDVALAYLVQAINRELANVNPLLTTVPGRRVVEKLRATL